MFKATENGWICKTWIETAESGWTWKLQKFDAEEDARDFGYLHNRMIQKNELAREFEVYKDFIVEF